jgi:hypothetical protein
LNECIVCALAERPAPKGGRELFFEWVNRAFRFLEITRNRQFSFKPIPDLSDLPAQLLAAGAYRFDNCARVVIARLGIDRTSYR